MSDNKSSLTKWLPLIGAALIAGGVWIGFMLGGGHRPSAAQDKLNRLFEIIEDKYVDEINLDSLVEMTIPQILKNLDPHSSYIPYSDLEKVNGELESTFGGIGIQFQVMNDTICVVEVISGGPSEKVGIMAGDRIIGVDSIDIVKRHITDEDVRSMLRGPKGTEVSVTIKRNNSPKPLKFDIVRGDIPVTSVDASYMITDSIGYVKVSRFARNTYNEFLQAISDLRYRGAKSYILDLRGNGGGFMEPAIMMVNEFLDPYSTIVMTKGRNDSENSVVYSDGTGTFASADLVVLVDEFSASSSEIFAGAIQDNDRGLIIGRRSFGKGLVQSPFEFPDSSAMRLTVQRYYTPSGRCIQKDFKRGRTDDYEEEIVERYNRGEIFSADSIKLKTDDIFKTRSGRTVYGGGGIMPDVFVPSDTSGVSSYYINVSNAGLLTKYAYEMADLNRDEFSKAKNVKELTAMLPSDATLLRSFVQYAVQHGVPARWYYINISSGLIVNQLKALIARDVLGVHAFYEIFNTRDNTISEALRLINEGAARTPVGQESDDNPQMPQSK